MTDEKIVELFWERSEDAILELSQKYGKYCWSIAYGILRNSEDTNECVNDAYLNVWNSIPPNRPDKLGLYLGRITRNIAINKYNYYSAKKRQGTQLHLALEELVDCVSGDNFADNIDRNILIKDIMKKFLEDLSEIEQKIFVSRYWYFNSISEIAQKYNLTDSYVKVSLYRSRCALKIILEKEGLY